MTTIKLDRWQARRGTAADLAAVNEVLLDGEVCIETDTNLGKIGDGATNYNSLPYALIGKIDLTGLADGDTLVYNLATSTWGSGAGGAGAGGDDFAVASGTDTITAVFATAPTLVDGLQFKVRAAGANTTTTPTFNPNSLGALTLYKLGGVALAAGDISGAGHELIIRYRASPARYELVNPAGVQTLQGGTHTSIDNTDPRKPAVNVTGLSAGAGYAEGTSFPASPGTSDKFYRNDLNLLCYFDGTRWLTVEEYSLPGTCDELVPLTSTGSTNYKRSPVGSTFAIYLTRWSVSWQTISASTSANYWTVALVSVDSSGSESTLATVSTQSKAAYYRADDVGINAAIPLNTVYLMSRSTKFSSGPAFYPCDAIYYRLIVT